MKNKFKKLLSCILLLTIISFTAVVPSKAIVDDAIVKGKTFINMGKTNTPDVSNITSMEMSGATTISVVAGWLLIGASVIIIIKLGFEGYVNPASGAERRNKRVKQMAMLLPIVIAGIVMINAKNITIWIVDLYENMMA